jgi:hypothetical protein
MYIAPTSQEKYTRFLAAWAAGNIRPKGLVRKTGTRWYVYSAENPSERLLGPVYITRKAALAYAEKHIEAVLQRLKEEANPTFTPRSI